MAKPRTITMVELRQHAERIVREVRDGQRMVLTYRGRPALRLEPIRPEQRASDDPFYALGETATWRRQSEPLPLRGCPLPPNGFGRRWPGGGPPRPEPNVSAVPRR